MPTPNTTLNHQFRIVWCPFLIFKSLAWRVIPSAQERRFYHGLWFNGGLNKNAYYLDESVRSVINSVHCYNLFIQIQGKVNLQSNRSTGNICWEGLCRTNIRCCFVPSDVLFASLEWEPKGFVPIDISSKFCRDFTNLLRILWNTDYTPRHLSSL